MEPDAHLDPTHFETPQEFGAWLSKNHDQVEVLWVGFWKKATGKPSITWPESVEEALCYGWIDGLRRSVDDRRYAIRFTPRRPDSNWSAKNLETYAKLDAAGRIEPPGRAAYQRKDPNRTDQDSSDAEEARFSEGFEGRFKENEEAWAFFSSQPPGYRKTVTHWVMSAKREATRERRLATLIQDSAAGLRIKELRR
jgi:uncharacterized protein YdeI (YjbR/CyaY-like superfamily)